MASVCANDHVTNDGFKFCPECGVPVQPATTDTLTANRPWRRPGHSAPHGLVDGSTSIWWLLIIVAIVISGQWLYFSFVTRAALQPRWGTGYHATIASAIVAFLAVLAAGLSFWRLLYATIPRTLLVLILFASTLLGVYANFYFAMGGGKNFSRPLQKQDAFELSVGTLTNATINEPKPATQPAKIMILSQAATDFVFIALFVGVGVATIAERIKDGSQTHDHGQHAATL